MQGSGNQSWSRQIADSFIARHPGAVTYDSGSSSQKWNYEQGLMLVALYKLWQHTNDKRYFEFMQDNLDLYVENDGNIKTYKLEDYNKDNIGPGRALLAAYQEKKKEKYKVAADLLMLQLRRQPRTNEGGFWHKKIYPYQMWLDGLFMAEPFHAWYAQMFNEPKAFDDIVNQFIWISSHTRDAKTGLYYHAWDESKQQRWANPETGCSPHFWGRAIGWYGMGLIDVLDYMPERHPKRKQLETLLKELAESLLKFRDGKSHLWYLLLDQGDKEGNYFESSASSMFAYLFAKGANEGYLGKEFATAAEETFQAIIQQHVTQDANGYVDLHETCGATGLGGEPYRDGSYQYYVGVPKLTNDKRGIGALLLAAIEIEKAKTVK